MANYNIIITPGTGSIAFTGSADNTIRLQVQPSGNIEFIGRSGSLLAITDRKSGSLYSVNDISGLPILEVFSDNRIVGGTFGQNTFVVTGSKVGIGTATPSTPLHVQGAISASSVTASLFGSASHATTASAATSITFVPATASYATTDWNTINNRPSVVSSSAQINTGSFSGSFTGSLLGTASVAVSASWAPGVISSSYAVTSSAATSITFVPVTASYAATGGSPVFPFTGSAQLTGTFKYVGPDFVVQNPTNVSFQVRGNGGTASISVASDVSIGSITNTTLSFVQNSTSAWFIDSNKTFAPSTTNVYNIGSTGNRVNTLFVNSISSSTGIPSASHAQTASYALVAQSLLGSITSASYALTASYATVAQNVLGSVTSASYAATASILIGTSTGGITGSFSGDGSGIYNIISSSHAVTASYALTSAGTITNAVSSSYALTASFATSASWAPGGASVSASYAVTASYLAGSSTGAISGTFFGDGSGIYGVLTASALLPTANLSMVAVLPTPSASAPSTVTMFAENWGGRTMIKVIDNSGLDYTIQPNIFGNGVFWMGPAATTTNFTVFGAVLAAAVGTVGHPTLTSQNARSQTRRTSLTSAATAIAAAEVKPTTTQVWRGNLAGQGGWFFVTRFAPSSSVATQRSAHGLFNSTTALATAFIPSASTDCVFIGNDTNDPTLSIYHNDNTGACTKVALGSNFPISASTTVSPFYDFSMYAPPNGSAIHWRVKRIDITAEVSGTIITDLPTSTTFLAYHGYMNNGVTAAAVSMDIMKTYIETDH